MATAKRALTEFDIAPIATTIPLHLRLLDDKNFQAGDVDTKYIEREVLDGK
ncbi:MAG: hypothetical protein AAF656_11940 [Planctomycetota bacterium]